MLTPNPDERFSSESSDSESQVTQRKSTIESKVEMINLADDTSIFKETNEDIDYYINKLKKQNRKSGFANLSMNKSNDLSDATDLTVELQDQKNSFNRNQIESKSLFLKNSRSRF